MKAISSMATRHVLADLNAAAVKAGHPGAEIESVGGVDAASRVAAGEQFDLVFLALGALKKLAEGGHVVADTVTPLMLSQVAVAVASGTDEPAVNPGRVAFEDAAAVRAALLGAERIGYSTGPSGVELVAKIEGWGLTAELGDRLVQARPGVPVAQSLTQPLAQGGVDLGFQQLSELVGQPGVKILGVLPQDCAIDTVFGGAVATIASDIEGARSALGFFASEDTAALRLAHNFGMPQL